MNAEDLVLNFKKGMANLSKTERRRAIESVRDVIWHHQNTAFTRLTDVSPRWLRRTALSCESFERSHPRNSSSLVAVSSYLSVVDAPRTVHLHRWDPDEVLPLRLVRPPQ